MMKWLLFMMLVFFCVAPIVIAQADCPAIVTAALNTAAEACVQLGRDQACYGNVMLEASPHAGVSRFSFEQTGDLVDVTDLETLRLNSMSLEDSTWGIALMKIQANIPDESPENVTLVMFGNVNINNDSRGIVEVPMTATGNVNVRLRPRTDENNIIASLTREQSVIAIGRLADGTWIQIELEGDAQESGWVSADFLTSDEDVNTLTVVEPGKSPYAPMQVFTFGSGGSDRPCEEAPDSGILIQTPDGVGEINLLINEVDIRLGSTVYLQANANLLTVSVVEGYSTLEAEEVTQIVPAGTFSTVPLDGAGVANGAPTYPQPYNQSALLALPLNLLPQVVGIAPPLVEAEIETVIATVEADIISIRGFSIGMRVVTPDCGDTCSYCVGITPPPYDDSDTTSCDVPEHTGGLIIDGPVVADSIIGVTRWYRVQFDNGIIGWAVEDQITLEVS
jgi:hypothetical protein